MSEPRVSVVMPTRDHEAYLREALQSVLAQTWQNYEVIVVDGASETPPAGLKDCGPGIKWFYQPPKGVSAARNLGLEKARGEFVAFLDSDDVWDPEHLQTQIEALSTYPEAILSFTNFRKFGETHDPASCIPMRFRKPFRQWVEDQKASHPFLSYGRLYRCLLLGNVIPTSSVVLKRKEALDTGSFDESLRVAEDYDYWLRLAFLKPVVYVDRVLVSYRMRTRGLSGPGGGRGMRFAPAHVRILEKQLTKIGGDRGSADFRIICEQLAQFHYRSGAESFKKRRGTAGAYREISRALGLMKTVGLTFVQDRHTWLRRVILLMKPYFLWCASGICAVLFRGKAER